MTGEHPLGVQGPRPYLMFNRIITHGRSAVFERSRHCRPALEAQSLILAIAGPWRVAQLSIPVGSVQFKTLATGMGGKGIC